MPRTEAEGAVTLHVSLDWLVRVEGTTDPDEARRIVRDYMADQTLHDHLAIDPPDEDDWELTTVLYPDDVTVPADTGLATSWSTYTRPPAGDTFRDQDAGRALTDRALAPAPATIGTLSRGARLDVLGEIVATFDPDNGINAALAELVRQIEARR